MLSKSIRCFLLVGLLFSVAVSAQTNRGDLFRMKSDLGESRGVCIDIPGFRATIDLNIPVVASPSPWHPAVLSGVVPEPGVTFVAKAMSLAPCEAVEDELKLWAF